MSIYDHDVLKSVPIILKQHLLLLNYLYSHHRQHKLSIYKSSQILAIFIKIILYIILIFNGYLHSNQKYFDR